LDRTIGVQPVEAPERSRLPVISTWHHVCPRCEYLKTENIKQDGKTYVVDWYLCPEAELGESVIGRTKIRLAWPLQHEGRTAGEYMEACEYTPDTIAESALKIIAEILKERKIKVANDLT